MTETVFVLGAGVNQSVQDWHSLKPPLARDFFKVLLKHPRLAPSRPGLNGLDPLFGYIEKYWKKPKSDLLNSDFDLEECFTMLETQRHEAIESNDGEKGVEVSNIEFSLKSVMAELLSEFGSFASTSGVMRAFGDILLEEKPTIISFNYDTLTEAAIESASGLSGPYPESMHGLPNQGVVTEEEISFSHHKWNRPLAYGFKFDVVQLHRAGVSTTVDGRRFYANSHNQPYDWPILKLHGSLNWFRFLPFRSIPFFGEKETEQPKWMQSAIVHLEGHWWMQRPPDYQGWYLDPLLITPILNKDELFKDLIYKRVFSPLWKKALEALSTCKKLVIIGYSFSPADFRTTKLFREAFALNTLEKLTIVNPNQGVVEKAKDLCHFDHPEVFADLKGYVVRFHDEPEGSTAPKVGGDLAQYFEDGKRLILALDRANVVLTGTLWFLFPDPIGWRLIMVSSALDTESGGEFFSKVQTVAQSLQPPINIRVENVLLLVPSHPLVNLLKRMVQTGPGIGSFRVSSSVVDGFPIEDSLIYRLQ